MSLSRLVARPLLAAGVVYGAVNALRETDVVARKAERVTERLVPAAQRAGIPLPDDPATLVRLNAGVQLLGGLAIATGKAPRLGATAVAASLVPTTVAAYPFWSARTPEQKLAHQTNFFRNLSIIGGALIAAGDTDGKPSLGWRARRAAKDARREARHLATSAKREARLAKAKVS